MNASQHEKVSSKTSEVSPLQQSPAKRIISFDFLRGGAIIGVLAFHLLNVCYDYKARLEYSEIPIAFYFLVAFLGFLGSFYTLFILVSAVVNTVSMEKQWQKRQTTLQNPSHAVSQIFFTQLIRGCLLIFFAYLAEVVLNGYVLKLIIADPTKVAGLEAMKALFHSQILATIGWGVIICSFVYMIMLKRQFSLQKMTAILLFLGVGFVGLRYVFLPLVATTPQFAATYDNGWMDRSFGRNVIYFFASQWINGYFPLLPNISLSFFGTAIGLQISDGHASRKLLTWITRASGIFFVVGIVNLFVYVHLAIFQHFPPDWDESLVAF